MRKRYLILVFLLSACAQKHHNLPDIEDQNDVPAPLENRQEESMNLPDSYDENDDPGFLEGRDEEEERVRVTDPPLFGD